MFNCLEAICKSIHEHELTILIRKQVINLISIHVEKKLTDVFQYLHMSDWNLISWVAPPSRLTILNQVEEKLGFKPKRATCDYKCSYEV